MIEEVKCQECKNITKIEAGAFGKMRKITAWILWCNHCKKDTEHIML